MLVVFSFASITEVPFVIFYRIPFFRGNGNVPFFEKILREPYIILILDDFHPRVIMYAKSIENPCHFFGILKRNEEVVSCRDSVFRPWHLSSRTFHRQFLTSIPLFTNSFILEIQWNIAVILVTKLSPTLVLTEHILLHWCSTLSCSGQERSHV
jgi:hypothetical protein